MDSSFWIYTTNVGWSIIYQVYRGVTGYNFQINCISLSEDVLSWQSIDPVALCRISSGPSLLTEVHIEESLVVQIVSSYLIVLV